MFRYDFTQMNSINDHNFSIYLKKKLLKLSPPPNVGVLLDIPSNSILIEGGNGDKPTDDTKPGTVSIQS